MKKALPLVLLAGGLGVLGLVVAVFGPKSQPEVAAPVKPPPAPLASIMAAQANPNDLGVADRAAVDPMDLMGRARTRALAWSPDAVLVAMKAQPVADGRVDVASGGTVEYWFGKPTGEGLGATSKVAGKRFRVALTANGTEVGEVATAATRAALEPNCPLDEAVRKGRAAGLPLDAKVSVTFETDEKLRKAVWRLQSESTPPVTRVLDGWNCAVVISR